MYTHTHTLTHKIIRKFSHFQQHHQSLSTPMAPAVTTFLKFFTKSCFWMFSTKKRLWCFCLLCRLCNFALLGSTLPSDDHLNIEFLDWYLWLILIYFLSWHLGWCFPLWQSSNKHHWNFLFICKFLICECLLCIRKYY